MLYRRKEIRACGQRRNTVECDIGYPLPRAPNCELSSHSGSGRLVPDLPRILSLLSESPKSVGSTSRSDPNTPAVIDIGWKLHQKGRSV
jgi:hypothetical protein